MDDSTQSYLAVVETVNEKARVWWDSNVDAETRVKWLTLNRFENFVVASQFGLEEVWNILPNVDKASMLQNENYRAVVMASTQSGNVQLLHFLEQKNRNMWESDIQLIESVFDLSVELGHIEIIRFLLAVLNLRKRKSPSPCQQSVCCLENYQLKLLYSQIGK